MLPAWHHKPKSWWSIGFSGAGSHTPAPASRVGSAAGRMDKYRIFHEWPISRYLLAAIMFELAPEYCMGNLAA